MPTRTKWHVEFYPPGDDGPWLKSLRGLKDVEAESEITHRLEELADVGPFELLSQGRVKKLAGTGGQLFELRVRKGRNFRVIFTRRGQYLWVLMLLVKKTPQLSKQDLQTALQRAAQLP
ncbi:MAG TPA: type II toxin-antitoxin system RelE/ParE family toxin [Anaerolineae bacterium]|nr:type II toxin-antitoxin system RelE/ParE family toxin [Anaerolineae bacterium]HQJ50902.1 type II toxin-antitoxin system RelE/ParE family toxin [Anaerolineae bacterium]